MLGQMIKSIFGSSAAAASVEKDSAVVVPTDLLSRLESLHQRSPIDAHLDIAFRETSVAGMDFLALYRQGLTHSGTHVKPWKAFRRPQAVLNLLRYFDASLKVEGARAECGVLYGFSAWLMCRVAQARGAQGELDKLHLIDSFAGFAAPAQQDAIAQREGAAITHEPICKAGDAAVPLYHVQGVLADFATVQLHQGFIPGILTALPLTTWSFVHVDVDLYEPTLACLEYFHPRLAAGGTLICDDYGTSLFPGAARAWDRYCDQHHIPFVVLDTGQSVILNTRSAA